MGCILILSRGKRVGPILASVGRSLSRKHKVVATLGLGTVTPAQHEEKYWKNIPHCETLDLFKQIETHWSRFKRSHSTDLNEIITEIEGKIGLKIYECATNFLIYKRFAKAYYKHWDNYYGSDEELAKEFVGSYLFFNDLFKQIKPNIVFCETADTICHRMAQAIAYRRGTFTLQINFTTAYRKGQAYFVCGSNRWSPQIEFLFNHPEEINASSLNEAKKLLEQCQNETIPQAKHIEGYRKQSAQNPIFHRIKKLRTPSKINTTGLLQREVRRQINYRWLKKHFKHSLPESPYVLFALHHQPEAATGLLAPKWVDQNVIAEQLSINAPYGMKIVIKENPRSFGLRGKEYFGALADLPNVHLLHPSFDNQTALSKAQAVVALTGTVGLEGIFLQKRVVSLGNTYYTLFPGIRKISHPSELFEHLKDPTWKPQIYRDELERFTAAFIQSQFHLGPGHGGYPWPKPPIAGPNFAKGVESFMKFTQKFKLHPSDFGIAL